MNTMMKSHVPRTTWVDVVVMRLSPHHVVKVGGPHG